MIGGRSSSAVDGPLGGIHRNTLGESLRCTLPSPPPRPRQAGAFQQPGLARQHHRRGYFRVLQGSERRFTRHPDAAHLAQQPINVT